VLLLQDLACPLFGVRATDNAALWRDGNPMNWAKARTADPAIPVLLAHGSADDVLPRSVTLDFAQALEDGGHPVQVKIDPGADHATIYPPGVIADTVATWTNALAYPR
jgi:dipeptidyl aminopeptidase/acylaminoacyl peptidase